MKSDSTLLYHVYRKDVDSIIDNISESRLKRWQTQAMVQSDSFPDDSE